MTAATGKELGAADDRASCLVGLRQGAAIRRGALPELLTAKGFDASLRLWRQSGCIREEKTEDHAKRESRRAPARIAWRKKVASVGINERMYIHKTLTGKASGQAVGRLPTRRAAPGRPGIFDHTGTAWLDNDVDGDR